MNSIFKLMLQTLAAFALTATVLLPALAQSARDREREENDRDLERRVFNLGTLPKRTGKAKRPNPQLTPAQLQEDFRRIQVVNNNLADALSQGGAIDLKFLAKSASEIRARAERLKDNLMLPKTERAAPRPKPEDVINPEQVKRSLFVLYRLIIDFTHNPIFKVARPDDAELSAKAMSDLEEIIELSGHVRKGSEQLRKASQKLQ
jgi:hypothetical protein